MTTLHERKPLGYLLLSFLVAGCQEYADVTHTALSDAALGAAALVDSIRPEEVGFNKLASVAPSSAGYYVNREGRMVVRIGRDVEAPVAEAALRRMAAKETQIEVALQEGVEYQRADFSFIELNRWRNRLSNSLPNRVRGLTSLDLNEVENRVVVGIEPQLLASSTAQVLDVLRETEVPARAVQLRPESPLVSDVGEAAALGESAASTAALQTGVMLTQQVSPVRAGFEVGVPFGGQCTLGLVVDRNGERGFVTASHCSAFTWTLDYSLMRQNSHSSAPVIGIESRDPGGYACLSGLICRGSDASYFGVASGSPPSDRGIIARPTNWSGSLTVDASDPHFIIAETASSILAGSTANKVGRTTGWTMGSVYATCIDKFISDGAAAPGIGPRKLICATEATYGRGGGDSGAPVFTGLAGGLGNQTGTLVRVLGIHQGNSGLIGTGSNAVFSTYSRIASDLGGSITAVSDQLGVPGGFSGNAGALPFVTFSWNPVPNATRYAVYKRMFANSTWTSMLLTETSSTSFYDSYYTTATAYDGTIEPVYSAPRASYWVHAIGGPFGKSSSPSSQVIWFSGEAGCSLPPC